MKLALCTLIAAMGLAPAALADHRDDYRTVRLDLVRTVKALEADSARAYETARHGASRHARPSKQALQWLDTLCDEARDLRHEVGERDRKDAPREFHDVLRAYGQAVAHYSDLRPSPSLDRDFDRIDQSMDRLSYYFNQSGCRSERGRASRADGDRWGWRGDRNDHDRY